MPSVEVVDLNNSVVGSLELSDEVFDAPLNKDLLYEAVRHSQAARRGGNAKTKTRHEVSGSGKKLWRQKGTGRARVGSIRSPLWRHGGTTHGPQPRDYSYKLPRKMMLGALRSALSAKLRDGELRVVQDFSLADHKTKAMRAVLDVLGLEIDKLQLVAEPAAWSQRGEPGGGDATRRPQWNDRRQSAVRWIRWSASWGSSRGRASGRRRSWS